MLLAPAALLLLAASTALTARVGRTISGSDLLADVKILRRAYEELHPGLYRYLSPAQLASLWKGLEGTLQQGATLGEAYLEISKLLARIQCGHSYANFFNQGDEVKRTLLERDNRLPFHFRWLGGKMIVTQDRTGRGTLAPGDEVVRIDGVPAADILKKLLGIARADGNNRQKRISSLEVQGQDRYEAFDIYYPLLFPVRKRFDLEIRKSSGEIEEVEVKALSYRDRLDRTSTVADTDQPVWTWAKLDPDTTLLTMPGWALYNSKWNWQEWLNGKLDELAASKAKNLVIDLRGNEGGLDCGDEILARLPQVGANPTPLRRVVRFRSTPTDLNPYLDTWDTSFRFLGLRAKSIPTPKVVGASAQAFFQMPAEQAEVQGRAERAPFNGKVYVLVDSSCSSATFQFANVVKSRKLGLLVGEPTGGNQRGINGGAFFFLRLPNSKIEVDLPLIASMPEDAGPMPPNAGLVPDVRVETKPEDVRLGRDPQLAAVRKLIAR